MEASIARQFLIGHSYRGDAIDLLHEVSLVLASEPEAQPDPEVRDVNRRGRLAFVRLPSLDFRSLALSDPNRVTVDLAVFVAQELLSASSVVDQVNAHALG